MGMSPLVQQGEPKEMEAVLEQNRTKDEESLAVTLNGL